MSCPHAARPFGPGSGRGAQTCATALGFANAAHSRRLGMSGQVDRRLSARAFGTCLPAQRVFCLRQKIARGCSSAGRAPALQAGGQRFDPAQLHQMLARGRSSAGRALQSHCRGRRFDSARLHHCPNMRRLHFRSLEEKSLRRAKRAACSVFIVKRRSIRTPPRAVCRTARSMPRTMIDLPNRGHRINLEKLVFLPCPFTEDGHWQ